MPHLKHVIERLKAENKALNQNVIEFHNLSLKSYEWLSNVVDEYRKLSEDYQKTVNQIKKLKQQNRQLMILLTIIVLIIIMEKLI